MDVKETLSALMASHDTAPDDAGRQLWQLVEQEMPSELVPQLSWLGNHVIGELLREWPQASRFQQKLTSQRADVSVAVWRNAAVAALMAGDPVRAYALELRMQRDGLCAVQAAMVVRLAVIGHALRGGEPEQGAAALTTIFGWLDTQHERGAADAMLAAGLNNAVSALLDVDDTSIERSDTIRHAIAQGARLCRDLWQRAGTWINEARADYLCALAHARLGQPREALAAAERGLKVIEAHGDEEIDRAFLLLEAGRARISLGDATEGQRQIDEAARLAAGWNDPSLTNEFDEKAASIRRAAS
ncbi:hypothetical protein WS67_04210 [Burkholderia singularis]|uniref:Uncharacterized protein n=1 Tax=Burkholderia singularis TaxID=1503053 RepID=A0A118DQR4_9BURK|nr:hypothetical protein [Burkholderia singularis]KVE30068.1 hypothetical protein WS67_04210 [Burkholderia singularis]